MSTFLNFTFVQREVHILFRISRNRCLYFHLRKPRLFFSQPFGDACRKHGCIPRKSDPTFLLFPLQPFKLQLPPTRCNAGPKLCAQEDGTVLLCVFLHLFQPLQLCFWSWAAHSLLSVRAFKYWIVTPKRVTRWWSQGRMLVENIWEFPRCPKEKTLAPERTGSAAKWQNAFNILPGNGAL